MSECTWINGPDPYESNPLRLEFPARLVSIQNNSYKSYISDRFSFDLELNVFGIKNLLAVTVPSDEILKLKGEYFNTQFRVIIEEVV